MEETGIVARAFDLARAGTYGFVALQKALKKEGFTEAAIERHLGGGGIRKQLREACRSAQEATQSVK